MILLTGATGTVGSELVKQLQEAGVPFRALLRSPEKGQGWKGAEVVKGDLSDLASVNAAMKGITTLFLLTMADPATEEAVISAAKAAGVKKVVKISAMGASPDSPITLARGHARAERFLTESGLRFVVLRPGMFAQNFLNQTEGLKKTGRYFGAYGTGRIAPIDARDIAAVALVALTTERLDGKTLALTGPAAIDHAEALAQLSKAVGRELQYVDVPAEGMRATLAGSGMPAWLVDDLLVMQTNIAKGGAGLVSPGVKEATGREPRPFSDFARDWADEFR